MVMQVSNILAFIFCLFSSDDCLILSTTTDHDDMA